MKNLGYFFKEGARSMFSHGFMSFAAVGVTVACLLIMGTFTLVAYNANVNLADLQKENAMVAFVDDSLTESQAKALKDKLEKVDNVADCTFVSRQEARDGWPILSWITQDVSRLNIVATYTLLFNGSLLVDEGLGYAICFDKLINTTGDSSLCFRPLLPALETTASVVWKKYQVLTKAAEKFLEKLQAVF